MKRVRLIILALLPLLFAAGVVPLSAQQDPKAEAKARKQQLREEKQTKREEERRLRQEIRRYQHLRDSVVVAFARKHQPASVFSPFNADFSITDIICAGDTETGTVMLWFTVTSRLLDDFRLLIGGEHSGTRAYAGNAVYSASSYYGQRYTMRTGMPQDVVVTLNQVDVSIPGFDLIDIGVGFRENPVNMIQMRNVPIYWTGSNHAIRDYVKSQATNKKPE